MANKSSGHIADIALTICTAIFIITTALLTWVSRMYWLILLQSLSAAAVVGGFADWYGVVSIYGKPLGIGFKTEIVVSKRVELFGGIRDFVCDDVISKSNITGKLADFKLADRILRLLGDRNTKDGPFNWLVSFISVIVFEIIRNVKSNEFGSYINKLLVGLTRSIKPAREIIRITKWSLEHGYDVKLINTLLPELRKYTQSEGLKNILEDFSNRTIENYTSDSRLRGAVSKSLYENLNESILVSISDMVSEIEKDPEHPIRKDAGAWIREKLYEYEISEERQRELDSWIVQWLEKDGLSSVAAGELERIRDRGFTDAKGIHNSISNLLEEVLARLGRDKLLKKRVDDWLLERLTALVDSNHDKLRRMVERNLNEMNDREMVRFIRNNTENDLQKIRLNGMLFGLLIGFAIAAARYMMGF